MLNVPNPIARAEFVGHGGFVKGVAVSADGRLAATASFDLQIILWDVAAQSEIRILNEHEGAVNAVALTPDGRHVVSASDDGTVRLWETGTGALLHTFTGHQGKIAAVAVSPDGKLAVSAGPASNNRNKSAACFYSSQCFRIKIDKQDPG